MEWRYFAAGRMNVSFAVQAAWEWITWIHGLFEVEMVRKTMEELEKTC